MSGRDASVRSHKSWQFAHVYVSRGRRKAETQKKSAPASQSPASRQRFCPCSLFFSTHSGKYTMQRCSDERLDSPATSIVCTVRSTRSSPRVRSVWFFGFGFLGFWVFGFWVLGFCFVCFFLSCLCSFVRAFVRSFFSRAAKREVYPGHTSASLALRKFETKIATVLRPNMCTQYCQHRFIPNPMTCEHLYHTLHHAP